MIHASHLLHTAAIKKAKGLVYLFNHIGKILCAGRWGMNEVVAKLNEKFGANLPPPVVPGANLDGEVKLTDYDAEIWRNTLATVRDAYKTEEVIQNAMMNRFMNISEFAGKLDKTKPSYSQKKFLMNNFNFEALTQLRLLGKEKARTGDLPGTGDAFDEGEAAPIENISGGVTNVQDEASTEDALDVARTLQTYLAENAPPKYKDAILTFWATIMDSVASNQFPQSTQAMGEILSSAGFATSKTIEAQAEEKKPGTYRPNKTYQQGRKAFHIMLELMASFAKAANTNTPETMRDSVNVIIKKFNQRLTRDLQESLAEYKQKVDRGEALSPEDRKALEEIKDEINMINSKKTFYVKD